MTGIVGHSPYLLPRQRDPDPAALRLLCFHHAGGAASSFAQWQTALGSSVAVIPVQLAGREHRAREPRVHDFDQLVDDLDDALDPLLGQPFALYGHSLGGMIAYALTRRRFVLGRRLPEQLLVGACPPPHAPRHQVPAAQVSDDELTRWMRDLGGMPDQMLQYPQWLHRMTALLRDDLRLAQSRPASESGPLSVPLPVPLRVLTGSADSLLTSQEAHEWERYTSADCRVFTLPGGHFFHRESPTFTLRLVGSLLSATAGVGRS
ncbi:thioesterase II family protein [Streptomyces sp. NPDC050287]|uniref:thioesterase II family protein n=1 Tax=Streptomyces sp. NPDC050287 TaxID=3365608 RepID=UPI003794ECF0